MLIVEDGTGKADAESYLSVAEFVAYCDARGLDHGSHGHNDTQREIALRKATAYVDTISRYKGQRLAPAQALEFPRDALYDWSGHPVTGVPKRVKDACAELASRALEGDLYEDLDRGGLIRSESVGPISTTYVDGAPAGKVFRVAVQLLEPYVRKDKDLIGKPVFGGTDTPASFAVGMHDNPEADPGLSS
jgi:hypothetical protein